MSRPNRNPDECLRRALRCHFDPRDGSPYWLERERQLGVRVLDEVRRVEDLALFGPFDREALVTRPLEQFVPRSIWMERETLLLGESGGTTGRPVRSVFTADEFEEGFGAPFAAVAGSRGFPRRGSWLFIGPSGPHIIGQAARLLARQSGAMEPFAVDLDPRFARSQESGSLGDRLYREHVLDQALDVIGREEPDVLFVTPPLALELAEALDSCSRERILGVHLGGMSISGRSYARIRGSFPNAVVLPGYGNSLFGLLMEVAAPLECAEPHLDYFSLAGRMHIRLVDDDSGEACLGRNVATGEIGRVVFSRLDRSFFLPNCVERDRATRIEAGPALVSRGFSPVGVRDPHPVVARQAVSGLY